MGPSLLPVFCAQLVLATLKIRSSQHPVSNSFVESLAQRAPRYNPALF